MMENLPRGRRSRRSSSNLNLTNISPLTTHFSLNALADYESTSSPQTSYIQGVSAPSTPSILSRAPSRKRTRPLIPALSVPGTPRLDVRLPKAKSASHLLVERRRSSYFDPRPIHRNESTEWVHRAGIALTSEARESKGQSWLARRASSTSLLSNGDSDSEAEGRRVAARGSKKGSRSQLIDLNQLYVDIPEEGMHPLAPDFIDEAFMGSSFDEDEDADVDEDDEELHWSKRPRTGLGAWVDRMVGWSLFAVDEDIDSDEEHEPVSEEKADVPPHLKIPDFGDPKAEEPKPEAPQFHDASVWSDAGWVLGLAAKVVFQ
ncbi:hypothetical protein H072_7949 [Dactylellina haptotyla CBS 200.50]|uniref:Uncharacterized protein n=1 Tax=Dactylellina haptotyla (strain CBS 200.50) TaxID=1284197 RepID=S8A598_DACHA|nr:hypothetical protein H072_7949 [Dactylellina haptotyla CBS 200.50]